MSSPEKQTCPCTQCRGSGRQWLNGDWDMCFECSGSGLVSSTSDLTPVSGDDPKLINKSAESYLTANPIASEANPHDIFGNGEQMGYDPATPDEQPKLVRNPDGTPIFGGGHYDVGDGRIHFNGDRCAPAKPIETDSVEERLDYIANLYYQVGLNYAAKGWNRPKVGIGRAYVREFEDLIAQREAAARREAILSMHDSIMRHELPLGTETDLAFNYARIHHWIERQAALNTNYEGDKNHDLA